jgi:1-acyl-sn-glycerol-3-phosphate acyltransferase
MENQRSSLEKPRSERVRAHLTRLPRLNWWRRAFRRFIHLLARLLTWLFIRKEVSGLETFPREGPALIVSNHLGDADLVVGLAITPVQVETVGKIELFDLPVLGWILDLYGLIWIHRGQADRRALRVVLRALKEGRLVAIAPEGRESITGSLEEGTGGAAYLALKSGVPIVPVTFTHTENKRVFRNMKRLRKTDITVTIGKSFSLDPGADWRKAIQEGTEKIMLALARQLPEEYRGVYQVELDGHSEH